MTAPEGNANGPVQPPSCPAIASERVSRVAVLIDWDNFHTSCTDRGIAVSAAKIKRRVRTVGTLCWSAVFVDSSRLPYARRVELFTEGFDIQDCPKLVSEKSDGYKDLVDAAIIEKMQKVADFLPVDEVVLGSVDRDYIRVVQQLRDAGKRVRILTPTHRDNPVLLQHSDGAVPYVTPEAEDEVLGRISVLFESGSYRADDRASDDCFRVLGTFVQLLDARYEINRAKWGFRRMLDAIRLAPEVRGLGLSEDDVKRRLEFLIEHGVIARDTDDNNYVRYCLVRAHPFIVYAYQRLVVPLREQRVLDRALS